MIGLLTVDIIIAYVGTKVIGKRVGGDIKLVRSRNIVRSIKRYYSNGRFIYK